LVNSKTRRSCIGERPPFCLKKDACKKLCYPPAKSGFELVRQRFDHISTNRGPLSEAAIERQVSLKPALSKRMLPSLVKTNNATNTALALRALLQWRFLFGSEPFFKRSSNEGTVGYFHGSIVHKELSSSTSAVTACIGNQSRYLLGAGSDCIAGE
jgi:hypothetical protein